MSECTLHFLPESQGRLERAKYLAESLKPHSGETELWSSMARFLLRRITEDKTPQHVATVDP